MSMNCKHELCGYITVMCKKFYGITQQQLRKLVYQFAVTKNKKHVFSTEKGMAGKCFINSFLKRNPGISLRLPEPTSLNRVLGFNKTEIGIFFANLEALMSKYSSQQIAFLTLMKRGSPQSKNPVKFMPQQG